MLRSLKASILLVFACFYICMIRSFSSSAVRKAKLTVEEDTDS